jgi:mannose-binding lectin 1
LEQAKQQLATEERTRAEAEFEKQQKEYEKERQKYKEQHPDKAKDDDDEAAKYYEDAQMRELRMIYESQANIHRVMQQMETKLQEIYQQQQVHTSILKGGGGAVQQQQQHPPMAGAGEFSINEKNELIQGVREISATLRDMKNYVTGKYLISTKHLIIAWFLEIYTRSYNIEQKIQQGIPSGAAGGTGTIVMR